MDVGLGCQWIASGMSSGLSVSHYWFSSLVHVSMQRRGCTCGIMAACELWQGMECMSGWVELPELEVRIWSTLAGALGLPKSVPESGVRSRHEVHLVKTRHAAQRHLVHCVPACSSACWLADAPMLCAVGIRTCKVVTQCRYAIFS